MKCKSCNTTFTPQYTDQELCGRCLFDYLRGAQDVSVPSHLQLRKMHDRIMARLSKEEKDTTTTMNH